MMIYGGLQGVRVPLLAAANEVSPEPDSSHSLNKHTNTGGDCGRGCVHTHTLTELRDAAHTGGQQSLLQGSQLQLDVSVLSALH